MKKNKSLLALVILWTAFSSHAIYVGEKVNDGEETQSVGLDISGVQCGGVFVREDIILTAAHCFYDDDANLVRARRLLIDPHIRSNSYSYVVKKLIVNPKFVTQRNNQFTTQEVKYDFALLKVVPTKSTIKREDSFKPTIVDLVEPGQVFNKLKLVGMGLSKSEGTLYKTRAFYESFYHFESDSLFRVTPENTNISVCKGDSGSGVFNIDQDAKATLVGVISASEKDCGKEGQKFYVASLKDQLSWIEEKIRELENLK